ncbi:hypothetical protein ACLB2K_022379 [Fragaria x ananassa]
MTSGKTTSSITSVSRGRLSNSQITVLKPKVDDSLASTSVMQSRTRSLRPDLAVGDLLRLEKSERERCLGKRN